MLVHLESQEILGAYRVASVSFDEALVEVLPVARLPSRWRRDPAPAALQRLGDAWVARGSSAVLRVPSVIIADEWNYLLNPSHPDLAKCVLGAAKAFRFR
jgi:RES domain-containing protein